MTTTREYFSADGFPIRVNLTQFTFEGERLYANRKRKSYFDLSGHHLSRPMCEFLITHCSSLVSATLNCYGTAFGSLLRFFADSSYSTLNGESFAEYVKWLKHQKTTRSGGQYAESTRRTYGIHLLRFMEWLTDADEVANNETDTARQAFIRAFKGYNARGLELLRLRAISPDEYIRLIRAARLEYETCKDIVNGSLPTKREYDITFPLLPFSILVGAQLGLRPVEFNYLTVGDLKGEYLALNPPNKKSSVVWLPPSVKACLDLAQKWMLNYRPNPTRAEPLLACPSNRMGQALVRFDTPLLTSSLKKFYRKYFDAVTIGLSQLLVTTDEEGAKLNFQNATVVAKALASLIANNPVSGSPRLDGNVIDITLALMLLTITNHLTEASDWLAELVERADFTFKIKRNFPIGTDSLDDLADATVWDDDLLRSELMKTSWFLATLAGWAVILERNDLYDVLSKNTKSDYPEVGLQLWHPTEDVAKHLYYWQAQYRSGEAEAPIVLPDTFDEYRDRMKLILASNRYNIRNFSPALLSGMDAIDLVASRHFRTPVAPYFWYRMLPKDELPNHDRPTT